MVGPRAFLDLTQTGLLFILKPRSCMKVEVAVPVPNSPYGLCGHKAALNSKPFIPEQVLQSSLWLLRLCQQRELLAVEWFLPPRGVELLS